eukprot:4185673-Prymnesium_polylepis.1
MSAPRHVSRATGDQGIVKQHGPLLRDIRKCAKRGTVFLPRITVFAEFSPLGGQASRAPVRSGDPDCFRES